MTQAMIVTVGTGPTVAHGIAQTILSQPHDLVLFIGSEESLQKTLPDVLQISKLKKNQYEVRTVQDPDDVEQISIECLEYIKWLIGNGFQPENITADFTSGTKAMSAGLVAAGLFMEISRMSYVHGERDKDGRVISGTERVTSLEPNHLLAKKRMNWAIHLFNRYQFEGCLRILSALEGRIGKPGIKEQLTFLERLAKAYFAWDRFELKTAKEILAGLENHPLASEWGIKRGLKLNNSALHQEDDSPYNPFRAVDLLENAKRRAEEGKFDDAVARLYRLIEYLAQVKLYQEHEGLLTADLQVERLPEQLRDKYEHLRASNGKIELGLIRSYELLKDLNDPLGSEFMKDYNSEESEVRNVLGMRNISILAHGFNPIGESACQRCLKIAQRCLDLAFNDWQRIIPMVKFPKLKGNWLF